MKLTVANLRASEIPDEVKTRVLDLIKKHHTRWLNLNYRESLYMDEGADLDFFLNGEWKSISMMSEFGFHAGGKPIEYKVGSTMPLPFGVWVVESNISYGKWYVNIIHNNGQKELKAG